VIFEDKLSIEQTELIGRRNLETLSFDAACGENQGIVGFQYVDAKRKNISLCATI